MVKKITDGKYPQYYVRAGCLHKQDTDCQVTPEEVCATHTNMKEMVIKLSQELLKHSPDEFYEIWNKTL